MFKILRTIIKTTSKTMKNNRRGISPDWKYNNLIPSKDEIVSNKLFTNSNPQFLKSSNELKELMFNAIKSKKKENAEKIIEHIRFHNVGNLHNYRLIIKTIKKAFKNIDISDLL